MDAAERTSQQEWIDHAEQLIATGYSILATANVVIGPRGAGDVKVLACTLLARTMSNLRGVLALAKLELVVEARVLVRCCFENQIRIAGLQGEGDKFAERMRDEEIRSRQARGQFLFEIEESREALGEAGDRLKTYLQSLKGISPKNKSLAPKEVADQTSVRPTYMLYSQLSADAGHPTLSALNRYIVTMEESGERIRGIDAAPTTNPRELTDTLSLACMAALGVCVGANEILEGTDGGLALDALAEEYLRLSALDGA